MAKKTARRQAGDGSIHQRPNGTWCAQIDLGLGTNGERRRKTLYAKTPEGILKKLNDAKVQLRQSGDLSTSETQLGKWLDYWLENIAAPRLKPKTLATYRVAVTKHIKPSIGTIRLGKISPAHLRKMHTDVINGGKDGRSPTTAHHAHRVLSAALKDAMLEGKVYRNIAAEMRAPSKAESERTGLAAPVAMKLLASVPKDDRLRGRWMLALLYGMRQGERLGLRWSHVDFNENLIDLSWSLSRVTYTHGCREKEPEHTARSCPDKQIPVPKGMRHVSLHSNYVLLTPKTKGSVRVVPMLAPIRRALEERRAVADTEQHRYDFDLVWCEPDGRPIDPRKDWQAWTDLLEAADVPHVTLHEARNTAATLMLEMGVDAKTIGAILGHSQIVTTRGYQRVSVELAKQALEGLATRLELD